MSSWSPGVSLVGPRMRRKVPLELPRIGDGHPAALEDNLGVAGRHVSVAREDHLADLPAQQVLALVQGVDLPLAPALQELREAQPAARIAGPPGAAAVPVPLLFRAGQGLDAEQLAPEPKLLPGSSR